MVCYLMQVAVTAFDLASIFTQSRETLSDEALVELAKALVYCGCYDRDSSTMGAGGGGSTSMSASLMPLTRNALEGSEAALAVNRGAGNGNGSLSGDGVGANGHGNELEVSTGALMDPASSEGGGGGAGGDLATAWLGRVVPMPAFDPVRLQRERGASLALELLVKVRVCVCVLAEIHCVFVASNVAG
jgi:hypothetical protein